MRPPARRAAALVVPALLAAPAAVHAQLPNPLAAPGPRVGVMAGLSSATFGGSDATFDPADGLEKKRRNGLVAGAYLTRPLVAGLPLSIRPELLYAQKGVRARGTTDFLVGGDAFTSGTVDAATKLDYLELPVLLQLDVPSAAGLRPAVYAGPSVAYLLRCRVEGTIEGTTTSSDCDAEAEGDGPRKFDVSGVVGGQLGFALAGQAVGVGVRYTHGFIKLDKNTDVKNRAFAVYGSLEFGR